MGRANASDFADVCEEGDGRHRSGDASALPRRMHLHYDGYVVGLSATRSGGWDLPDGRTGGISPGRRPYAAFSTQVPQLEVEVPSPTRTRGSCQSAVLRSSSESTWRSCSPPT